jgi:hypothetical protein
MPGQSQGFATLKFWGLEDSSLPGLLDHFSDGTIVRADTATRALQKSTPKIFDSRIEHFWGVILSVHSRRFTPLRFPESCHISHQTRFLGSLF